jgi:DEAD/DEAH box helicase domain-containing protein
VLLYKRTEIRYNEAIHLSKEEVCASMNVDQLADSLRIDPMFMQNVVRWDELPARAAAYEPFPQQIDQRLKDVLEKRGIHQLYRHQAHAVREILNGHDVVVVTPTASGKTMCYNLPVLSAILENDDARALYLFPTKALSADQVSELYELIEAMGVDIKTYTYDGDTPGAARKAVRQAGHIVVTNPDMLHSGILPHHTKWVKLFENLRYIVIDEIHMYRGIFGSNLANVLRRLMRICQFYGSHPQFILCSATIANPQELAQTLTGRDITLIDDNGAPMGVRHFVFYNPPVVNRQLGIRKGVVQETRRISGLLLQNGIQAITFARSRLNVEVLTRYLKDIAHDPIGSAGRVRGYRGGYLPTERRDIEQGLRAGRIDAVVSTNALELGIDIGALDACVLCGYPGTIASAWQQAGRAGRRKGTSIVFYVASSAPIDQYIVSHPDYLMKKSPENALLNPDNLYILLNHFKCAAFELPFEDGEGLGNAPGASELLAYLEDAGILRHVGGRYHWSAEDFPASEISLRSARAEENFIIIDISDPAHHRVIGEMDRYTVPMLLHENAIYMHEAQQYQVEKLDFEACKAYIRRVNVDYYTDADLNLTISLLDKEKEEEKNGMIAALGEIRVSTLVTMFKKIKFDTHETIGFGHVRLPETDMHTTAMWWTLPDVLSSRYASDTLQNGMMGIANLLRIVAPLSLMCAPQDVAVVYQVKSPLTDKPTILLYDQCPGGIGLAQKAYAMRGLLLEQALQIVEGCPCRSGCPSCVGPVGEVGEDGKATAMALLKELTA